MIEKPDAIDEVIKKQKSFHRCFSTADGKVVLDTLLASYDGFELVGDTVEATYFNLGCRHVVREMLRICAAAEVKPLDEDMASD